jgi:hypothetical protein
VYEGGCRKSLCSKYKYSYADTRTRTTRLLLMWIDVTYVSSAALSVKCCVISVPDERLNKNCVTVLSDNFYVEVPGSIPGSTRFS